MAKSTSTSQKSSNPGASRKDAYAADYAALKSSGSATDRHVRGDDPLAESSNSVNSALAQQRYKS